MLSEEQQNREMLTGVEDPNKEEKPSPTSLAVAEMLSLQGVFPKGVINKDSR